VFNYTSPPYNGTRAGSGQTVLFSSGVTIDGSNKPEQVFPIRVDKGITQTPDLVIRGVGNSVIVRMENFRNAQTGGAGGVNPSGATFTITFSDGSTSTFTAP
jgi:hypothetical protein